MIDFAEGQLLMVAAAIARTGAWTGFALAGETRRPCSPAAIIWGPTSRSFPNLLNGTAA